MEYRAKVSFSGIISMAAGQVAEIADPTIAKDLLKAGYIEEVKEDTRPTLSHTKIDKSKIGYKFEYNGVNAIVLNAIGDQYILAATGSTYGTWDEAVAYCQRLGGDWRLPSSEEFKSIYFQLLDNNYWTYDEIDGDTAKFFNWSIGKAFESEKNRSLYILPIAIVDAESVEFK